MLREVLTSTSLKNAEVLTLDFSAITHGDVIEGDTDDNPEWKATIQWEGVKPKFDHGLGSLSAGATMVTSLA